MNAPPLHHGTAPALDLTIARGADGRSRLAVRHVSFPWSLGRGYSGGADDPVMLIPQVAGAGLLAGDHVVQRIHVTPGAALHLASAGAMLTYGTPGGRTSVSDWTVDLDPGARAYLVSEPYVLFDDADLTLRQCFVVAPDATLIGCEGIVCASPGNRSQWHTETIVRRPDGTPVFTDRQTGSRAALSRQAALAGGWIAFGTVLVLTPKPQRALEDIGAIAAEAREGLWIGISPTRANSGVCARIAARDGQRLRAAMTDLVVAARAVC